MGKNTSPRCCPMETPMLDRCLLCRLVNEERGNPRLRFIEFPSCLPETDLEPRKRATESIFHPIIETWTIYRFNANHNN